jgi:Secretion system C-terminal sorting domain
MRNIYTFFLFTTIYSFSQAPNIQWQKTFGGSNYDLLNNILNTADGGYLFSGYSYSTISGDKTEVNFGSSDYWIVKTDSTGSIEWQKNFGGTELDSPVPILKTSDGGYLIAGNSISDISGNKTVPKILYSWDDLWLLKLDSFGNVQWQKNIGGSANDWILSMVEATDGGFVLGAASYSSNTGDKTEISIGGGGTSDYWIIKIDSFGNIIWQNTIGSVDLDKDVMSVLKTDDGGYLIGGSSNGTISADKSQNTKGNFDCWIVKLNALGNVLWDKTIGGSQKDELRGMIKTSDGNYLICASSNSNISGDKTSNCIGGNDLWFIKIDSNGTVLWDKTVGGSGNEDTFSFIEVNNNIYIGAYSDSNISGNKTENNKGYNDFWIIKTDNNCNVIWDKTIGGNQNEYCTKIIYNLIENSIIIGGSSLSNISFDKTENSRGFYDYWIIKLNSENLSTTTFLDNHKFKVFPNPTNGILNIDSINLNENYSIKLYNSTGHELINNQLTQINKIDFNYPNGIYLLEILTFDKKEVFKIIKE